MDTNQAIVGHYTDWNHQFDLQAIEKAGELITRFESEGKADQVGELKAHVASLEASIPGSLAKVDQTLADLDEHDRMITALFREYHRLNGTAKYMLFVSKSFPSELVAGDLAGIHFAVPTE